MNHIIFQIKAKLKKRNQLINIKQNKFNKIVWKIIIVQKKSQKCKFMSTMEFSNKPKLFFANIGTFDLDF